MKCPYCAEAIQPKSIVCRYCHQILGQVTPRLEMNSPTIAKPLRNQPTEQVTIGAFPAVVTAALGVLATAVSFLMQTTVDFESALALSERSFYITVVLLPGILGLLLGGSWPGEHLKAYLFAGLGMGTLNLLVVSALVATADSVFNTKWAIAVFVVSQPLIFASCAWLADKLGEFGVVDRPPGPGPLRELVKRVSVAIICNVLGTVSVQFLNS